MKVAIVLVAILAVIVAAPSPTVSEKIRYDNHKVFKLRIENEELVSLIEQLEYIRDEYNIWKEYDKVSKEIHIMVAPTVAQYFINFMKLLGVEPEVFISNVQDLIDAEQSGATTDDVEFGWTRYHSLVEIEAWLDKVLAENPDVTSSFMIGKSYEGREIRGIKISHRPNRPAIFIESNIHAREWITSATATWFINELLTSTDSQVRKLAEEHDFYIIPVFNVDGFVYSHDRDRMWRKTRQGVSTSNCIGTDGNRNFDSYWMVAGASSDPCSETFAGPQAFSEPETKALADFVDSIKDKVKIYLSFHSYGQYLLYPYGHTYDLPENNEDLEAIGEAFATAIKSSPYGTVYTYGTTSNLLYLAAGSSVDYAYNVLGIKVGFTIEYRDKGRYGFILPPVQILPNCKELMNGILALVGKTTELGYIN